MINNMDGIKDETRRKWTRDELLLAINLYCRLPFGKLHTRNLEIIDLSKYLNRTPGSVAMKLVNFASLDPSLKARDISGLQNTSKLDREVWGEVYADWETLAFESQKAFLKIQSRDKSDRSISEIGFEAPIGETEADRITKTRLVQGFFRNTVLASYNNNCCFCSLNIPSLLVASHIIPWKDSKEKRADPTNGLCLCSLHDKAFDRGFLGVDADYRILVSSSMKKIKSKSKLHTIALVDIEGIEIILPNRFFPDLSSLEYHREKTFIA